MAPSPHARAITHQLESGGENLVKGLESLLDDLERGKGRLAIKMTDSEAFELGHNIAVTPGKVVYQTDLMQLIQYQPSTEKAYRRPLLMAVATKSLRSLNFRANANTSPLSSSPFLPL